MAVVVAQDLSKKYGDRQALHPTSFTLDAGTVTVLAGPNGAGKSTLLKRMTSMVAGGGHATYDGRLWRDLPNPRRVVGIYLGSVPFQHGMRVVDHLSLLARMADVKPSTVDEMVERLHLADQRGKRVSQLSMGMRQRLGIASALLADPPVLVLDEPFSALDPHEASEVYGWVRDLVQSAGRTLLISTHHLDRIEAYMTHVLLMSEGRLRAHGTTAGIAVENALLGATKVACSDPTTLHAAVAPDSSYSQVRAGDLMVVEGLSDEAIRGHAAAAGVAIFAIWHEPPSLSTLYSRLIP